jgi:hypothetical protein
MLSSRIAIGMLTIRRVKREPNNDDGMKTGRGSVRIRAPLVSSP